MSYTWECTPPERADAVAANKILIPEKSRHMYEQAYRHYLEYCRERKITRGAHYAQENVFKYISALLEQYAPTTVRSRYSMLKTLIQVHDDIELKLPRVEKLLEIKEKKFDKKKSKVFTRTEIQTFMDTAPDGSFLTTKVATHIALYGCLRKSELLALTVNDISPSDTGFTVHVKAQKSNTARNFHIEGPAISVMENYYQKRSGIPNDRFLLACRAGKIINSPVGINNLATMPRKIAEFLGLEGVNEYTGHAFRRTAATWAADSGVDLVNLKRLGGWQSDTVAQGYIGESVDGQRKRAKIITGDNIAVNSKTITSQSAGLFTFTGNNISFNNCMFNLNSSAN